MAKTRNKKQNRSPISAFGNSTARVVTSGFRVKVAGHRTRGGDDTKMVLSKDATPVFVGRVYTGVPRGKQYPYAGKKRSGDIYKAVAAAIFKAK